MFSNAIFWWANLLLIIVAILLTIHVNCYCEEIKGNRKVRRIVNVLCGCFLFSNLMPILFVLINSDLFPSQADEAVHFLYLAGSVIASILMAFCLIRKVRQKKQVGMVMPAVLTFVLVTALIGIVIEIVFANVMRGWNMPVVPPA